MSKKYISPCVHQFPRDIERKVKKLKKECPVLFSAFHVSLNCRESLDVAVASKPWVVMRALVRMGLLDECPPKNGRVKFTLTPLGKAAIEMEGK